MTSPLRYQLISILFVFCCSAGMAFANPDFAMLNRLRAQAGLLVLEKDETLTGAAELHAAYLDRHREPGETGRGLSAHSQQEGREGFSGETPAARALVAGYPHREVLENVSMGYADAESAMQGLMSAIYHRLTFLDFESDRLGVAVGKGARVFLLGRDDVARLCLSPPTEALSRVPVDCLGQSMTREYYEALCAELPEQALFRSSHPVSCPNGTLLDAAFMAAVCDQPPLVARFRGHGRYFAPCDNGTRVAADWFNTLCDAPPADAAYRFSGRYYEVCEGPQRVHAEWLEARCEALPVTARYTDSGRYRRPCAADSDIRVEYLDELDAAKQRALPDVVVWPPEGATAVPPAFFVEEPDPLPDLQVSGYPLSIQFNPAKAGQVSLQGFALFRLDGETREMIEPVRLLDHTSDPNQLLNRHEFALFPLHRLDWGASYVAVVDAKVDGRPRRIEWRFETSGRGTPLLKAAARRERFVVHSGLDYLLYLPPQEASAYTVLSTRTEHLHGNAVSLTVVDPNTLRVRVDLRYCDRVKIQFDDGRLVELVPEGCRG